MKDLVEAVPVEAEFDVEEVQREYEYVMATHTEDRNIGLTMVLTDEGLECTYIDEHGEVMLMAEMDMDDLFEYCCEVGTP